MNSSGRRKIIFIAVLAVAAVLVFTSGCIGVLDPTPKEVKIRGNIICTDSDYISDALIWSLCFDPNAYENELFNSIDKYMPADKAVVEVGAGIGVITAYVNEKLVIETDHLAVEANPYMIEVLEKTKELNNMGCTFVQRAVSYDSPTAFISISGSVMNNGLVRSQSIVESVEVPASSIQNIVESSDLSSKSNLTVILDVGGFEHTIIQHETAFFKDSVETVIASVSSEGRANPDSFAQVMNRLGFTLKNNVYDDTSQTNVMSFIKK